MVIFCKDIIKFLKSIIEDIRIITHAEMDNLEK